jgi:hypothetical protein
MNDQFNTWWDSSELLKDNPYREDSPAYWAWEGWCAAALAEREACAKLCMEIEQSSPLSNRVGWEHGTVDCAAAIRARKEK